MTPIINKYLRKLTRLFQRTNAKLNTSYLEQIYQSNYLELARSTDWMKITPLSSPTGGTACFSFLYILLTILRDEKLNCILELGVGQSTKILLQYQSQHHNYLQLIDDDEFWLSVITQGNRDSINANYSSLITHSVCGKNIQWYNSPQPSKKFQLILIDGPKAYNADLKYNRLGILNWIPSVLDDEFIILVDDSSRDGEDLLVREILKKLHQCDIQARTRNIVGANSQTIIATVKYQKFLYL